MKKELPTHVQHAMTSEAFGMVLDSLGRAGIDGRHVTDVVCGLAVLMVKEHYKYSKEKFLDSMSFGWDHAEGRACGEYPKVED